MRYIIYIMSSVLFICCAQQEAQPSVEKETTKTIQKKVEKEFQFIIDSADVKGAILIYDLKNNIYHSNDFDRAEQGHLPASTYKIPNSIIGLEIGEIQDETTIFKWDGEDKWMDVWEQDLVFKDAFHFSCVPCYQDLARRITSSRMNNMLEKLKYGAMDVKDENIDMFWLEGQSRINQMQQIDFLKRFYSEQLPISKKTHRLMSKLMIIEQNDEFILRGKTGLSNTDGQRNGWFVGYIETKTNTYFFATNVEPKGEYDMSAFAPTRKNVTTTALKQMSILD